MFMNSNTGKLEDAKADKKRPRTSASAHPSIDDDFREFFNRGDIGDYEGGVARSQPPSKQKPVLEEPRSLVDASQQKARRAFFARVVAAVVTACIALLVTATRFKPHNGANIGVTGAKRSILQTQQASLPNSPVAATDSPTLLPAPQVAAAAPPAPVAAAPPPPAADTEEVDEEEHNAQPAAGAPDLRAAEAAKEPQSVAKEPQSVAKGQSQSVKRALASARSAARQAKASVNSEQKTPEAPKPVPQRPAPVAAGQSVAAFPVD
jgi:hypothetical protein